MMKNNLENSYLDCISFNSTKTRYYVGENIFSSNQGVRFWIDYKRPIEFTAGSTGYTDDLRNLNIKCEQVEASINDITDKEIIVVISNYKILKIHAYKVFGNPLDNINALLFNIGDSDEEILIQSLIYVSTVGEGSAIFLTFDKYYIEMYLSLKNEKSGSFVFQEIDNFTL